MKNNLKELRERKRFDQYQLAEMVGVNPRTISQWENGKNSMKTLNLIKLCEVLECSPNMLLGWDADQSEFARDEDESELLRKWRRMDAQSKIIVMASVDAAQQKKLRDDTVQESCKGIA